MSLKTYTIFLASSNELKDDRTDFSDIESQLNKLMEHEGRNVRFSVYKFEHDTDSFAERRKQDVYNDNINGCHIFIMLYGSKVGMYTEEEFDFAYQRYKDSRSPQVLVFKKSGMPPIDDSVGNFEKKINGLHQQFESYYSIVGDLANIVIGEIYKYFSKNILKDGIPAITLYNDGQSVPSNFMGRVDELEEIRQRLDKGRKLMLINADGGIGKTTLAAKYWQESIFDYKYNAWLFCEKGIVEELKKLVPQLEPDLANKTEEQQIDILKQYFGNISDDFLLVLDNADREGDIEHFVSTFNNCRWHVLITSRQTRVLSNQVDEYHIEHLPPPVAKRLFLNVYEEETPEFDALLDRFLEGIGYHTLLIEMFSKYMFELRVLGENFADMLAQLESKGLYLEGRSLEVRIGYNRKQTAKTDDILNTLYDLSKLKEEERYYLVNMALLPAVPHKFPFICELFEKDKFEFKVLKDLAKQGWLSLVDDTYKISPVTQKIVIAKNKERLVNDSNKLIRKLNEKLDNDGIFMVLGREARPYAAIGQSIFLHLTTEGFYDLGILASSLCVYCLVIGQTKEAMDLALHFKAISEHLKDKDGIAIACQQLGNIYSETGLLDKALEFYNDFHKLEKELHKDNPEDVTYKNGLAIACHYLGKTYRKIGNTDKAYTFYTEYYTLQKGLFDNNPESVVYKNNLAIACQNLGIIYSTKGDNDKALDFFKEYYRLENELYESNPENSAFKNALAIACHKLGNIYSDIDMIDKALHFYNEYHRLKDELHKHDPENVMYKNGLAIAYQYLGNIYIIKNEFNKALEFYNEYYRLEKELYENNPGMVQFAYGMGVALSNLANCAMQQGKISDAKKHYKEAYLIFYKLVDEHPEHVEFQNALFYTEQHLSELEDK